MLKLVKLLVSGWLILIVAVVLNMVAGFVGLADWYQLLRGEEISSWIDWFWLLIVYPLGMGSCIPLAKWILEGLDDSWRRGAKR